MANISNEINNFKNAIYGKDVRNSMITLAEKVNKEVEDGSAKIETFENNENLRVEAETARAAAESSRVNAEKTRVAAESLRVDAETKRATAENSRVGAESSRVAAESSRVNAESKRATAESSRVDAESSRVEAETSRASAESKRVTAETSRASAESKRVTAEKTRVLEFDTMKSQFDNFESNMTLIIQEYMDDDGNIESYGFVQNNKLVGKIPATTAIDGSEEEY